MKTAPTNKKDQAIKLWRFARIYGMRRAANKALGRLRKPWMKKVFILPATKQVSIIGCGQFAFSCISYFLAREKGRVFLECYDVDKNNEASLVKYYGAKAAGVEDLIQNPDLEILYIASNHATHTPYAVQAMKAGIKKIQIEKPISTTYEQLVELMVAQRKSNATLYAGYNRPNSAAIRLLKSKVEIGREGAFSLNYFISGHLISHDHWYRNPEEGTRICGNMGHWIDMTIHILAWRYLPELLKIQIAYSNLEEADDNITISLTSEKGDIASMMLTSRTEPFEGINETINFQYQGTIAKIDDFRKITIWQGSKLMKKRFFPKDVGHKRTILQPFYQEKENRDWQEVVISTLLMLHITDMVRAKKENSIFHINENLTQLEKKVNQGLS